MDMEDVVHVVTIVAGIFAIVGGGIALLTYRQNTLLKRAEWLDKLHARFFESTNYKRVRRILDYRAMPEYEHLQLGLTEQHSDQELCESFVDYLNFFELIASLLKLDQLNLEEVKMLFEYYLRSMHDHNCILDFIREYGFENLAELLKMLPPKAPIAVPATT